MFNEESPVSKFIHCWMRSYFYELELLLILLCLLLLYAAKGAKKNGIYSHNTFNLCTVIFCQREIQFFLITFPK